MDVYSADATRMHPEFGLEATRRGSTAAAADHPAGGEAVRLAQQSILVVDDGDANRRLIELFLSAAGAAVVTAENGLQAIEKVAEQPFDLIVMDMQMPFLDGYASVARIRQQGFDKPIVALTGSAHSGDRQRCLEAGCDAFLTKPIDLDQLVEVVAHYLGRAATEGEVAAQGDRQAVASGDSQAAAKQGTTHTPYGANGAIHGTPVIHGFVTSQGTRPPGIPPAAAAEQPIESTLPLEDEEFRQVVVDFVDRLESRLEGIAAALAAADFETVRAEAHWLEGAGGTVGFPAFTEPAKALEAAAGRDQSAQAEEILATLQQIHAQIVIPDAAPSAHVAPSLRPPNSPGSG